MEGKKEVTSIQLNKNNPLIAHTLDDWISRSLETPPPPNSKTIIEIGDPKEHVEHVDERLDHYHADGDVICKLFELILRECA